MFFSSFFRLYVFIFCKTRMLICCSLYVSDPFPDSSTFPIQWFFLLGGIYILKLFDQVTYFRYIVGKSIPLYIILESLVSQNSPIFRGYAFFLAVNAH